MKRRDLIKKLIDAGFVFDRNGSNHDIYIRGTVTESVQDIMKYQKDLQKAY